MSNRAVKGLYPGSSAKGLTLLELIVVIAILSIVLFIVFPRLPFFNEYALNAEARRMAGLLRYLNESAATRKIYYRIWFYPEKESLEVETSIDGAEFKKAADPSIAGFAFSSNVDLADIVTASLGNIKDGEVAVIFNPVAGAEPFNLHLKSGAKTLTVSYSPYSGKVKILSGYV